MHLTPQERDKLLIFVAGELARARQGPRPQAQRPRGHRPDHLATCWSWPATARASPRS